MKTSLLIRARKHFVIDMVPTHTQRHNMRSWVRSVRQLGDKWLLSKQVNRVAQ
jgi:hypothetical protein